MKAYDLWHAAVHSTLTIKEAAAYCDGNSECYPEIAWMLGALFFGFVAFCSGILALAAGLRAFEVYQEWRKRI